MSNKIQVRRGLETDRMSITPAEGEFLYVTDTGLVYIGDGSTAGGNPVGGGGGGVTNKTKLNTAANQNAGSGAATFASFDTVILNPSGVFAGGSPTRLTIPAGQGGMWQFIAHYFLNDPLTGQVQMGTKVNGSTFAWAEDFQMAGATASQILNFTDDFADGDYIEFYYYQVSGGTKTFKIQDFTCFRLP